MPAWVVELLIRRTAPPDTFLTRTTVADTARRRHDQLHVAATARSRATVLQAGTRLPRREALQPTWRSGWRLRAAHHGDGPTPSRAGTTGRAISPTGSSGCRMAPYSAASACCARAESDAEFREAQDWLLEGFARGVPYYSLGVLLLQEGLLQLASEWKEPATVRALETVNRVAAALDVSQPFTTLQLHRGRPDMFHLEMLQANEGDSTAPPLRRSRETLCTSSSTRGRKATWPRAVGVDKAIIERGETLELLVIHARSIGDHIEGVLELMKAEPVAKAFRDIWFNEVSSPAQPARRRLRRNSGRSADERDRDAAAAVESECRVALRPGCRRARRRASDDHARQWIEDHAAVAFTRSAHRPQEGMARGVRGRGFGPRRSGHRATRATPASNASAASTWSGWQRALSRRMAQLERLQHRVHRGVRRPVRAARRGCASRPAHRGAGLAGQAETPGAESCLITAARR